MCPFVDDGDVRCAARMTLANLVRAFAHCADDYEACPIYRELIAHGREYHESEADAGVLAAS